MMKKLIYTGVFTLALTSLFSPAWANGEPGDFRASHLLNSAALPSDASALNAIHKFEVHVQGRPLAGLTIDLPEEVRISEGIEVKNKSGQKIPATVSINEKKATVAFSQPVDTEIKLLILMKGVNTPGYRGYAETWQYRVYGNNVGLKEEIPLGLAQIITYPL